MEMSRRRWTLCCLLAFRGAYCGDLPENDPPPDEETARIVDEVAAQFVAARGRGLQGRENPALKQAARAYKAKVSTIPMPWAEDDEGPRLAEPLIPNVVHWAWRNGDADWTLALSVAAARVVQRPEKLLLHTGPLTGNSYTNPTSEGGTESLRCIAATGAEELRHFEEPFPGDRHPWAEVLSKQHKLPKQTLAHISDVMRLHTILQYGGIYLDRDAFLHRNVDNFRYRYEAVLGMDPETYEGDRDVNFGSIMAARNSTFFRLLWDGCGKPEYRNLSYLVTWGGWAHDSCRKSYALAMKRPDLARVDERLYQFPFPGKSAARGRPLGINSERLLAKTNTHHVLHMSGFEWNALRTKQLQAQPSIFGTVVWPNIIKAAAEDTTMTTELVDCLEWLQGKLKARSYLPPDFPEDGLAAVRIMADRPRPPPPPVDEVAPPPPPPREQQQQQQMLILP